MKTCEKCRETYRHLQSDLPTIANETTDMRSEEIARSLSKRIKKRKAAAAVFAVIFFASVDKGIHNKTTKYGLPTY